MPSESRLVLLFPKAAAVSLPAPIQVKQKCQLVLGTTIVGILLTVPNLYVVLWRAYFSTLPVSTADMEPDEIRKITQ